jgi:hypothetical protein
MNEATQTLKRRRRATSQEARRRAEIKRAMVYIAITIALAGALFLAGYGDGLALRAGDIH